MTTVYWVWSTKESKKEREKGAKHKCRGGGCKLTKNRCSQQQGSDCNWSGQHRWVAHGGAIQDEAIYTVQCTVHFWYAHLDTCSSFGRWWVWVG